MKSHVTIGATGDVLLHKRLYSKAYDKDKNGYNFNEMLEEANKLFKEDHLIIVNLESIIAGKGFGLSDFPRFNSPEEIGYKLKEMNVDIVNIANNHILDHGEEGLLRSIENLEKIGLPYVGGYKSLKDQETVRMFYKNGMRICFLSYTISTGLGKRPKGKQYLANVYGDLGVKWLRMTINKIKRELLADVVVVSIHFGKEYHMYPTSGQREIVADIADAGADVIIGHHPHVLQPPSFITDSRGRKVFVAYSLGNFFSGQIGLYRQIGAYMTVDVTKDNSSEKPLLDVSNPTMTLTFVDSSEKKDYKLRLLKDVAKEQEFIETNNGKFESEKVYERMIKHLTQWIPDLHVT